MTRPIERKEADETDLAVQLARGQERAFDEVVALYRDRVARLAHRLMGWRGDVDDVVQDVFLAVFRKAKSFRKDASLWTWLTVITVNCCRTRHRRQALRTRLAAVLPWQARESDAADHGAIRDEAAMQVRDAVATLPPRDREVVVLFYFEHKSAAEIGALVGSSRNAVEVRLHRARAALRTVLEPMLRDER
ncbi:MAG TPA: sigma-70 family RNA polymerase sigma factor [Tepidisphaeraceae bacterium]|nr:sigma-70 family RNA polymerase sigma factor [Tepidisphaeraceae bacterium]